MTRNNVPDREDFLRERGRIFLTGKAFPERDDFFWQGRLSLMAQLSDWEVFPCRESFPWKERLYLVGNHLPNSREPFHRCPFLGQFSIYDRVMQIIWNSSLCFQKLESFGSSRQHKHILMQPGPKFISSAQMQNLSSFPPHIYNINNMSTVKNLKEYTWSISV